jgi:hypothetical protein
MIAMEATMSVRQSRCIAWICCFQFLFSFSATAKSGHFGESDAAPPTPPSPHPAARVETDGDDDRVVVIHEVEPVYEPIAPAPALISVPAPDYTRPSFVLGLESAFNRLDRTFIGTASLGVDWERFGLNLQVTGIRIPWDESSGDTHPITLLNAYVSYALVSTSRVRLTIDGGAMSAFARDLRAVAPGIGFTGVARVVGPLGIEGAGHGAAYPYDELDLNAGLTVALGPIGVRTGWRRIWLNDRGLVDGVAHEEVFTGPYLGINWTF